jgi:hypothetical protein
MTELTVLGAFGVLRDHLNLDPLERARVIEIHNIVTTFLKGKGLIVGAFLQGSLARKTMIPPLRDIDKVVLLSFDYRTIPDGPQRAAETICDALKELYPDLESDIGKHCVTLDLGETTFSFDIVPAVDLGDDIDIINTEQRTWNVSNTRELIRVVSQRNKDCDGNFIHQVRQGRLFARHHLDGHLPGLHVESFAYPVITRPMADDEALAALLRSGVNALRPGGGYTDPTGRDDLARRLQPIDREAAQVVFDKAAPQAAEAVRLRRAGEHNAAIAIWHDLLGEDFPQPSARVALNRLGTGGGITAVGVVSRDATVRSTPTRAWRP